MTLKEISENITRTFIAEVDSMTQRKDNLLIERETVFEEYRNTSKEDARENAALSAAIEKMQKVNSDILTLERNLRSVSNVPDISNYNSVGIVVLFATVRLVCEGEEMIYKIYPNDISLVDLQIIAANCRLATALMGKRVGDFVDVEDTSQNKSLRYEIKEIY